MVRQVEVDIVTGQEIGAEQTQHRHALDLVRQAAAADRQIEIVHVTVTVTELEAMKGGGGRQRAAADAGELEDIVAIDGKAERLDRIWRDDRARGAGIEEQGDLPTPKMAKDHGMKAVADDRHCGGGRDLARAGIVRTATGERQQEQGGRTAGQR